MQMNNKGYLDIMAIVVGIVAIITNFIIPVDSILYVINYVTIGVASLACLGYLFYAFILLLRRRADFDWHLINGHFMRKVCIVVVLMPSLLNAVVIFTPIRSAKELLYQKELYRSDDGELSKEITENQEDPNVFWTIYAHFLDPGNQHMTTTKAGRLVAALVAVLGVFLLNGLLVSSIIGAVDNRKNLWRSGGLRYKPGALGKNRYAVVIGANEIAAIVINNLFTAKVGNGVNYNCEGENDYVVLHTSRPAEEVRSELSSHLSSEILPKVIIYNGLRDSKKEIEYLYVQFATEIYVLGESTMRDDGEPYHDAMNMRCLNLLADHLSKTRQGSRKVCKVMFEYQTTGSIFQFSDVSQTIKSNLVFIPFNRYESWARQVIVEGSFGRFDYTPLEGKGIPADSSEFVHLVIVGMSKMGIAMGLEGLMQAHYLNSSKARTRITFIDANADSESLFFKGRYSNLFELIRTRFIDAEVESYDKVWVDPVKDTQKWTHLTENEENFLDVEIEFIKGGIESSGVRDCLTQMASDELAKLTIAVCLTQTHQAIATGLYLPIEVYKSRQLQQVWVYQSETEDIISNLSMQANGIRYEKIRPFGMLYGEYMADRSLYLKALLVNVAYDITDGRNSITWPDNIYDRADSGFEQARISWKSLSTDKKWSNKYFADSIYIKLRNILQDRPGYESPSAIKEKLINNKEETLNVIRAALDVNSKSLAICEHNRWNIQQLLMGYSPCDPELDMIFYEINEGVGHDKVSQKYISWKLKNLQSDELQRKIKDDVKEGVLRIHPNICSFEHLAKVDSGALEYDLCLNNAIPQIISIVDGYVN